MAMFSGFPKEDIVLYKLSGEVIRGIHAIVEPKTIFIDDAKINIEEGDFFERSLPNGSTEIYHVIERGFYKGMGNMPDHYQTKVEKTNADAMKMTFENDAHGKKPQKVFISHSSHDKAYVEALVELLEDLGMPDGSIVCTSVPGHGIPGGTKIYDWLRDQFISCDLRVVFALSNNYYNSPASLNEMGAAWVTKATDTLILLPEFDFSGIKGCVDPTEVGMKLDGDEEELKHRLNEFKDTLIAEHGLSNITSARWERIRNRFIESIREIQETTRGERIHKLNNDDCRTIGASDANPKLAIALLIETINSLYSESKSSKELTCDYVKRYNSAMKNIRQFYPEIDIVLFSEDTNPNMVTHPSPQNAYTNLRRIINSIDIIQKS